MVFLVGLIVVGLEVWNLGLCFIFCVVYIISILEVIGGVMIFVSYNLFEDNGIKFFGFDGIKFFLEL